jgi:hypothetical protein
MGSRLEIMFLLNVNHKLCTRGNEVRTSRRFWWNFYIDNLDPTIMAQVPSLPVELLVDIIEFLRPHTPIIGHDAAWVHPNDLLNWWEAPLHRHRGASDAIFDAKYVDITVSCYASLLAVRQ